MQAGVTVVTGAGTGVRRAPVLTRVFGPWAPLVRLALAAKNARRFGSLGDFDALLTGRP